MDRILLRHLLDLAQAKLAVASGLPRNNKTFRITQSFLWREALSSSQTTPERVVLLLEGLIGCSEYNDYHNCIR